MDEEFPDRVPEAFDRVRVNTRIGLVNKVFGVINDAVSVPGFLRSVVKPPGCRYRLRNPGRIYYIMTGKGVSLCPFSEFSS